MAGSDRAKALENEHRFAWEAKEKSTDVMTARNVLTMHDTPLTSRKVVAGE